MKRKAFMLIYFISALVSFILTLSSCKTCEPCLVKTETKDSIVYRIDTVKIPIAGKPGPVIYLENPCKLLCDSMGRLKNVNIVTKKNGQTLNFVSVGSGLQLGSSTQ